MRKHKATVWLVNTGWTGGPYGVGQRMKLSYTRSMITAALNGALDSAEYTKDPVFGLSSPASCPGVPSGVLNPGNTWSDKGAYDRTAMELAKAFVKNFDKYASKAGSEILSAAPRIAVNV